MSSILCPDCGGKIVLGPKPRRGQWIACPHCNADLEIVSLNPLELDWARYFDDELGAQAAKAANPAAWEDDEEAWDDDAFGAADDEWVEEDEEEDWTEEEEK